MAPDVGLDGFGELGPGGVLAGADDELDVAPEVNQHGSNVAGYGPD